MTLVEELAHFTAESSIRDLPSEVIEQLKIRVLDSVGCAIGALEGEPPSLVRKLVDEFGGSPLCTLIGGGKTNPGLASLYNGALVRYLDFNDSFLAKGETCHPSDNIAPVLAAAEYEGVEGRVFLTALAVAYHVQCRLSEVAPVRARGFDHTTQGAYAVAAGASRALGLDEHRTANAIAIAGTALNSLRVTRTGKLSHWKGLAYANTAQGAMNAVFLAKQGITGPLEVFEGNKGFMDAISGPFRVDWNREKPDAVKRTVLKRYNAEIHSQSAIECALNLKSEEEFTTDQVQSIEVRTFDVAYNIIGGGEEGSKTEVRTKEEADHSLPYMLSVALLDGTVMPQQYRPERIVRGDVQSLLRRVKVVPEKGLTESFPNKMPCEITIKLKDGKTLTKRRDDYEGFSTRPMNWNTAVEKFNGLASNGVSEALREKITEVVSKLDTVYVSDLTSLLQRVRDRPNLAIA